MKEMIITAYAVVCLLQGVNSQSVMCQPNWTSYGNNCYWLEIDMRKSWVDAQNECQNQDSNLVTIETEDENTWLNRFFSQGNIWIGANDLNEGDWRWVADNSKVIFSGWGPGEPSVHSSDKDCAFVYMNNGWHDGICTERLPFICENASPCHDQPCKNGATCRYADTTYTGTCTSGFYGVDCEHDDTCLGSPCTNGATCNRVGSNYTCSCTDRYTGSRCTEDCRPGPADVLFIIDVSFSTDKPFKDSKATVTSIVNKLSIGIDDFLIAVMTYSFDAHLEFSFNTYNDKTAVISAIDNISSIAGPSYLDVALTTAKEVFNISSTFGARGQVSQYIIIVSDGLSTQRTEAVHAAQTLRSQGIKILAVGNGEQVDQTELLQLATATQYVFSGGREDDVTNVILMETMNSSCTDCLHHTVADIVFLVDVSLHQTALQQSLDSLKDLLYKALDFNANTHVGMVTFDLTAQFKFYLNQHTDRDMILLNSQIGMATTNRKSNISAALTFAHETGLNGNRPDARKVLVLFSNKGWTDMDIIIRERQALNMDNVTVAFVVVGRSADLDSAYAVAERASDVYYIEQDTDFVRLRALVAQTTHVECPNDIFDIRQ